MLDIIAGGMVVVAAPRHCPSRPTCRIWVFLPGGTGLVADGRDCTSARLHSSCISAACLVVLPRRFRRSIQALPEPLKATVDEAAGEVDQILAQP